MWGRRWTGRGWIVGSAAGRATQEERHARGVREKGRGLFWGKIGGVFACPPGGGRGRSVAIVALGIGVPPQNAARSCDTGWEPSLWRPVAVPAYPAYTPQIPTWEHRAGETDGCLFSPHFVYIVYHKIWRLSKMESGRKWKRWKNLEGAGLREMDMRKGVRGKEWKGGQVVAT